jgi:hypothetical protein
MSVAGTISVDPGPRRPATRARGSAFGIRVRSRLPVSLPLGPAASGHAGRTTVVTPATAYELERAWRPREASTVLERRFSDGRLVMSVEHDPELGFRVYAPRNGRHLVSPDGTRIVSAVPGTAPWRWQRLLFAQVLPLAATLQGLELMHASAVRLRGRTLAFVASAGTGKTSVAAHAVARGASLLTDDVLALELSARVMAHPGVATVNIAASELERMSVQGRNRLGTPVGRGDKVVLASGVVEGPSLLDSIYFLERPSSGALRIEPVAPDPARLLAGSFNQYVRSPRRIVNQLAVVAALAESVATFAVSIPRAAAASDVAAAVMAHAEVAW